MHIRTYLSIYLYMCIYIYIYMYFNTNEIYYMYIALCRGIMTSTVPSLPHLDLLRSKLTIPKTNKKQACCSEKSLISIHF